MASGQIRSPPQQRSHHVARGRMHHARRTTESQHRLIAIWQRQVHREEAELLMDHFSDLYAAKIQALLEPLLEHVVGNTWCQGEGGFLHEEHPIAQIHRIQKRGWFLRCSSLR